MVVNIDDLKPAMPAFRGLPAKYEHLITAIDAVSEESKLTIGFVKSSLLLEEQRMADLGNGRSFFDSAVVGYRCNYCHERGHDESCYWKNVLISGPSVRDGKILTRMREPSRNLKYDDGGLVCLIAGEHLSVSHASRGNLKLDSGTKLIAVVTRKCS